MLLPSKSVDGASSGTGIAPTAHPLLLTFSTREQLLKNFSKGLIINSLHLFVAVSGLFSKEDHESLCGLLWQCCLTQAPCEIQILVGFISCRSFPHQALINYDHAGYVFDYAVRGECPNCHARSNADRHQKVCLGAFLLWEQLILNWR
jgi:hypothetical protein